MSGNVWEWVQDFYGETYYEKSPHRNPSGPVDGPYHVQRGGSWLANASYARCTCRGRPVPGDRYNHYGFRLAMSK